MKISRDTRWLTCAVALLACSQAQAGEDSITLHDGPGHDLVTTACAICHSLDYIQMNSPVMTRARWETTVHKMIDKFGAPISNEDGQAIVNYLATHYAEAH
jgi:sulfite dehydrogenase (cytochrome) subunit B